jgi:hypothetical protein
MSERKGPLRAVVGRAWPAPSAGAAARAAGEAVGGRSPGPVQAGRVSAACAKEARRKCHAGAPVPCLL